MPPHKEQFVGCIIGQALGDALGFNVEGYGANIGQRYVTQIMREDKAGQFGRKPFDFGQYTDDTQLTRELIRSYLAQGGFDPDDYAERLATLYQEGKLIAPQDEFESVLGRLAEGTDWEEAGTRAPGNESAMRAAPVGLFYHDDPAQMIEVAYQQGRITHQDGRSAAAATVVAGAVSLVLDRDSLDWDRFAGQLAEWSMAHSMLMAEGLQQLPSWLAGPREQALDAISTFGIDDDQSWDGIPPLAINSVLWSLYAFMSSPDDYWESMCTAIIAGGDADTTAAIAGAISGAYNGLPGLPRRLAMRLNDQNEWNFIKLQELAEQCYQTAVGDRE